jgi:hypothetical protein
MPVPQVLVATGAKVQYVVEGATLPDGTLVRGWMAAAPKGDVIASDDHRLPLSSGTRMDDRGPKGDVIASDDHRLPLSSGTRMGDRGPKWGCDCL